MIRATSRWMAPISSALIACVALAQGAETSPAPTTAIQDVTPQPPVGPRPIEDRRLPGKQQVSGDAKWTTELGRQVYALCPGDAIIEALERGADLNEASAGMTGECARSTLFVRNDSAQPIQCKARLVYSRPDHAGQTILEEDRVIFAGTEDSVLLSYANASNAPRSFSASCFAVSATATKFTLRPECRAAMKGPSPDDFYPPAAKKRNEQGGVVLDYELTATSIPADVRVVQSSGFAELDSAALKYAKQLSSTSKCVGERTRFKVLFKIHDGPPAAN
jgi:TonB family protein